MNATIEAKLNVLVGAIAGTQPLASALKLAAKDAGAIARFGYALLDADEAEDAAACGRLAVALDPKSADGWLVLGCALGRAGKDAEAILAYEQTTKLRPKHARPFVDLAELYLARLEYTRAAACLKSAMALDPGAATTAGKRAQALAVKTLLTLAEAG